MYQEKGTGAGGPTPIRNCDIAKISRVLYTMQDVAATEKKREWLQDRLFAITQKITGMPGGRGGSKGLEASFEAIAEAEERYRAEIARWEAELNEAERIINAIRDGEGRTFVTMRYLMHMGRNEIMTGLNIKRWRFRELCEKVEQAGSMSEIVWEKDNEG